MVQAVVAAAGAGSGVLCPVCKSCQLVQRHGLLVCPAEGWRVNLAAESLSMDDIQSRLAAAYQVSECGSNGPVLACRLYCQPHRLVLCKTLKPAKPTLSAAMSRCADVLQCRQHLLAFWPSGSDCPVPCCCVLAEWVLSFPEPGWA
jgi:hypothetical protein